MNSDVYKQGLLTIQDESSMLVGHALHVTNDDRVLDCCAAPGGKTTHIAELLSGSGEVYALDLHKQKVKLIDDQVMRLQLHNVKTAALDARKASEHFPAQSFDKILIDAPCSGFGVIRRKPDLKWVKKPKDVDQISAVQLKIFAFCSTTLKEKWHTYL